MATIKIPYQYTKYERSPLATWADKTVQKGTGLMLVAWALVFTPLALVCALLSGSLESIPALHTVLTILALILILPLPIAFPFIFRAVWNARRLNDKLALWDMRRSGPMVKDKAFLRTVALLAAVLVLPALLAVVVYASGHTSPESYSAAMSEAFSGGDYSAAQGEKCTVYLVDSQQYTSDFLSKELTAKRPKDVRYILRMTEGTELYGATRQPKSWSDPNGEWTEIPLYYRTYTVEWFDCTTGTVVHTQVVQGAKVTAEAALVDGAYYGELPESAAVQWRLDDVYEDLNK